MIKRKYYIISKSLEILNRSSSKPMIDLLSLSGLQRTPTPIPCSALSHFQIYLLTFNETGSLCRTRVSVVVVVKDIPLSFEKFS